jgi:hypothetical protein
VQLRSLASGEAADVEDDGNSSTKPHLAFGQEDRDRYTLRRVLELGLTVAFECRACRRISQMILLDLVERYGITTTLGELRSKAVCSRCGKREVDVLTRQPGVRGDRAWHPRPPGASR